MFEDTILGAKNLEILKLRQFNTKNKQLSKGYPRSWLRSGQHQYMRGNYESISSGKTSLGLQREGQG